MTKSQRKGTVPYTPEENTIEGSNFKIVKAVRAAPKSECSFFFYGNTRPIGDIKTNHKIHETINYIPKCLLIHVSSPPSKISRLQSFCARQKVNRPHIGPQKKDGRDNLLWYFYRADAMYYVFTEVYQLFCHYTSCQNLKIYDS